MKIAVCASMAFYKDVITLKSTLEALGHTVLVPDAALKMERDRNFDVKEFFIKYYGKDFDAQKAKAIKAHFDKITESEAVLIINNTKHGIDGYIGPNVLMEMALAFHYNLKIFVLNQVPQTSPFIEEINAMSPVVLDGKFERIK